MALALGEVQHPGDVVEALQQRLAQWQGLGLEADVRSALLGYLTKPHTEKLVDLGLQAIGLMRL